MRIYNGKNSQLQLPLGNGQKISIGPKSISQDFLPSTDFLSTLVSTFDYSEIALIVNGVQELNLCSSVSAANGFVVYSVAEAVERFEKKAETPKNPAVPTEEKAEEIKKETEKHNKKVQKKKEEESENPSNS